jgi:Domain of unknown function (DUF4331)
VGTRIRRAGKLTLLPALGVAAVLASSVPAGASSHREAPLISQDPVADNTDVYAFVSPDKQDSVTLMANFIPFEEPAGGPNFYRFGDDVLYRLNVDNNGDAVPDITYDFRFTTATRNGNTFLTNTGPVTSPTDPDQNVIQTYSVTRTEGGHAQTWTQNLATVPANVGPVSNPNYAAMAAQGVHTIGTGKVFAGQRDDPFFADTGSIFDLGQLRPFQSAFKPKPRAGQAGRDGLGGFNVNSIALQVAKSDLANDHRSVASSTASNAVIGVWSTTYRRATTTLSAGRSTGSGGWVQVSRLGSPLVNEVVIPLKDKDKWNGSVPANDGQFASYVLHPELAGLITGLYGVPTPTTDRTDLAAIFLTGIPGLNQPASVTASEQLRLNMGVKPTAKPNPLGVLAGDNAGFPNGRRLADDVTDIELRAVAGGTPFTPDFNVSPNNDLGDGVNHNDKPFLTVFPYAATPWQGYQNRHGTPGSKTVPTLAP